MEYIIVTNIYNEAGNIFPVVESVSKQTKRPSLWIWIDDGSNDHGKGRAEIAKSCLKFNLKFTIFSGSPTKDQGNLGTIGLAWNRALPVIKFNYGNDFIAVADVDNRFPVNYFQDMIEYLEANPSVGVVAGQARGEPKRKHNRPMGGGKVVRWEIIDSIEEFWRFAPDSYINLKANDMGFETVSRDVLIDAVSETRIWSAEGRKLYGSRLHYVGNSIFIVGFISFKQMIKRRHGFQILRGFLKARFLERSEQSKDPIVRYQYSKRRYLRMVWSRIRK